MNIDELWKEYWEARELPDEMFVAPGYDGAESICDFVNMVLYNDRNKIKNLISLIENIVSDYNGFPDEVLQEIAPDWLYNARCIINKYKE